MSCRDDLPVVRERWQRFRGMVKTDDQPSMGALIAIVITAANRGSPRATAR